MIVKKFVMHRIGFYLVLGYPRSINLKILSYTQWQQSRSTRYARRRISSISQCVLC